MLIERKALQHFLESTAVEKLAPTGLRRAAVACVLAPDTGGALSFLLTRRSSQLRHHPGQFALPGGSLERGETAEEAARRELQEELAVEIPPQDVVGRLDDYPTRSGFVITPVVLWCDERPEVTPCANEVAEVFRITFEELSVHDMPRFRAIPESDRPLIQVPVRGTFVHAPTAAIIYQLWRLVWLGEWVSVSDYEQPVFAWR